MLIYIYLFIYLFIYLLYIYLFIYLLYIYLFIYLFIYYNYIFFFFFFFFFLRKCTKLTFKYFSDLFHIWVVIITKPWNKKIYNRAISKSKCWQMLKKLLKINMCMKDMKKITSMKDIWKIIENQWSSLFITFFLSLFFFL